MGRERSPLYLVYDGSALDGLLYRVVLRCPPVLDDFRSYEVLGRPYNRRDFFKGIGISVYASREHAVAVALRFDLGRGVAALELRGLAIAWAQTGKRGHLTVWAPAELLNGAVVQCDEHE